MLYCDGEEYERRDFGIYYGASWYVDDELLVNSIYVEDDKLYFDSTWTAWAYNGNQCGYEEFDHVWVDLLYNRNLNNTKFLAQRLEFFVDILKTIKLGGR